MGCEAMAARCCLRSFFRRRSSCSQPATTHAHISAGNGGQGRPAGRAAA